MLIQILQIFQLPQIDEYFDNNSMNFYVEWTLFY